MKLSILSMAFATVLASTIVFASASLGGTSTIATCPGAADTEISFLKVLRTPEGLTVAGKGTNGETLSAAGCRARGAFGPGIYLQCSIILPDRHNGYMVYIYAAESERARADVVRWSQKGNLWSARFSCHH